MTVSNSKQSAVCGAWPSPISAAAVAAGAAPLSQVMLDGADAWWLAGRASEGGRTTLLRQRGAGVAEITPAPFNVRTRVHEYGGGAVAVDGGTAYFSNFADNQLYQAADGAAPVALTAGAGARYADFVLDRPRRRLVAVCEDHAGHGQHPRNTIRAVGLDGAQSVLVEGSDFYAAPRLSPDGSALAWLCWDHPRMPWQGTELWLADVGADGALANARLVAGGAEESICQPEWSPGGTLHFVSDRSGWWNLYRLAGAAVQPLCERAAEFAAPHWSFGGSMYGFRSDQEIVCTYIENGISRLAQLSAATGRLQMIANPYQEIKELRVAGSVVALIGGAPAIALELARIDLYTGQHEVLARSITELPDAADLSVPESITYPSGGQRIAHAFYYPPRNAAFGPAPGSKPPLMVISHGGPTGMASNTLRLATQFWTSRGFAVLDVNYGGSSGFGRAYRDALKGQWGVIDVEDCVAGARHLAARGRRPAAAGDPRRQRRRPDHAVRADLPRRLQGRRQLLRRVRPEGARRRLAQVRIALQRIPDRAAARGRHAVPAAFPDQPRRAAQAADDLLPGPGRQGGAAAAVGGDGRRAARGRRAGCLHHARRRGPRPQGRQHRAHARSRAVFLPAHLRHRIAEAGAGGDRQPAGSGMTTSSLQRQFDAFSDTKLIAALLALAGEPMGKSRIVLLRRRWASSSATTLDDDVKLFKSARHGHRIGRARAIAPDAVWPAIRTAIDNDMFSRCCGVQERQPAAQELGRAVGAALPPGRSLAAHGADRRRRVPFCRCWRHAWPAANRRATCIRWSTSARGRSGRRCSS
jgi:hypothetical protein